MDTVKGTDILTTANAGLRWNIFVLVLLVSMWVVGEYVSLKQFETHVDVGLKRITADVGELKAQMVEFRVELRDIHKRMDDHDHERHNAR